ncbi:MAG: sugar phosphate isomerase/epimerase, partial [Spirochaetales bacterium]|nr:sugar phosphate isomerase/epimerase [Spirochaetales bacterium]
MKESIHAYFQLGTILWMSYPNRPVLDAVKAIARDPFFDAIEITQNKDDGSRAEEKKLLDQSHLRVCYGAQPRLLGPRLNPNAVDEEERKKAEKTLLEAIDEAAYFGAKGIAFLAGKWEEETKDIAYRQLLKTTSNLCAYAATKGMHVELEVFDYDVDKAALIGPAPLAARFAADVRTRHSNFGLLVDLSHFPITHEDSHQVIGTCRPYITHFHIGNAVAEKGAEGYGDLHQRFGFPGGANDTDQLLDFFRELKRNGFLDKERPYVLSFEVKPWKDEDEDIVVANTKRVINRAWALLED